MAAYAAAVSLQHIIDLIKNHPSPPICLRKQHYDSLTEIVTSLQEFLEGYVSPYSYSDEADPLEMRIAEVVYEAEDVIESYIVDNIHLAAGTTHDEDDDDEDEGDDDYAVRDIEWVSDNDEGEGDVDTSLQLAAVAAHDEDELIRFFNFYNDLQKAIEKMEVIKKEAIEKGGLLEAELHTNVSAKGAGFKSSSTGSKTEMVGFDDKLLLLKDRLLGGDPNRQVIPIVGMGGIGKTTIARHVFADKLIKKHFDICIWSTISQDFKVEQTLTEFLSQSQEGGDSSVAELGEKLHKYLWGRRYLVVIDDMWSIEVWDKLQIFFPRCGEGSRIIVTTRMSNLASQLANSSNSLCMSFLNEVDSWTLFSKTLFGEGSISDLEPELRKIGEKIVGKCKGLPLSIVVVGGLLARSERTQWYWEYIEKNLNSIVNLENEEYCLRVLKLSYNHLPAYLKPCFLYMGGFDEDERIDVSLMINLWVSEGFIKPSKKGKNLETVAREYLQELADRNLVVFGQFALLSFDFGSVGSNMYCKVHDLVRDVSLREAKKERFYYVYSKHNPPQDTSSLRRIFVPDHIWKMGFQNHLALGSWPYPRSYVCHDNFASHFPNFRLLRTLHKSWWDVDEENAFFRKDVFGLVNSRFLSIPLQTNVISSSISRLWSLHTLLVSCDDELEGFFEGPVEFWNMHQLKHVEFTGYMSGKLRLPLPPSNIVILENLHTLLGMVDLYLNEDVVTRIPNLTIFDVAYYNEITNGEVHSLSHLQRLTKLERFRYDDMLGENREQLQWICFPHSLNQIFLSTGAGSSIESYDVLQKIGQLPLLEKLVIQSRFFETGEWETIEGQFPKLKVLELRSHCNLKKWTVSEASHFPLLQNLVLRELHELEEIPSKIGEIAMLESIDLVYCSESAVLSAKKIVEEQEDLYGEEHLSFRVTVTQRDTTQLESLASTNFLVQPF